MKQLLEKLNTIEAKNKYTAEQRVEIILEFSRRRIRKQNKVKGISRFKAEVYGMIYVLHLFEKSSQRRLKSISMGIMGTDSTPSI